MTDPDAAAIEREIDDQTRVAQGLQIAVYSHTDPAANADLHRQMVEAEGKLAELRQQLAAAARPDKPAVSESRPTAPAGRFLGETTTGLRADVRLHIDPLPTGAYHLMDPATDPLLTVTVENVSRDIRRVCVCGFIEGLSAQSVRTVEIEPRQQATFPLHPTLFPERAQAITEVQRATLHVKVQDLDGKLESHNTYPLTCLARTASFNAVRDPETGELVDLSHYYGAWVTPHAAAVQDRIRRAAELVPDLRMLGYQADADQVTEQVAALYQSLRESEIAYVNSVIDYGAPAGMTTQRTRLPRESIEQRSANCIDATVLLASLLEGVSLSPAILLVPGHALMGWETWLGSNEWRFLETTMIGAADFDAACQSGTRQHEQFEKYSPHKIKLHALRDLRRRGIWPME